jgi:tRNA threonylcarbamoyladenosine biosynthesis protein TsaE
MKDVAAGFSLRNKIKNCTVNSEDEMLAFGGELAEKCSGSCIIFLQGELGAGKTTLVRGFLRKLGFNGTVKSPTYTLVENYQIGGKKIYHFDLYRLNDPIELENIGIRDYFAEPAIFLIEWPERAASLLPKPDVTIEIKIIDETKREIVINN